jgi:hypothetical protein
MVYELTQKIAGSDVDVLPGYGDGCFFHVGTKLICDDDKTFILRVDLDDGAAVTSAKIAKFGAAEEGEWSNDKAESGVEHSVGGSDHVGWAGCADAGHSDAERAGAGPEPCSGSWDNGRG